MMQLVSTYKVRDREKRKHVLGFNESAVGATCPVLPCPLLLLLLLSFFFSFTAWYRVKLGSPGICSWLAALTVHMYEEKEEQMSKEKENRVDS